MFSVFSRHFENREDPGDDVKCAYRILFLPDGKKHGGQPKEYEIFSAKKHEDVSFNEVGSRSIQNEEKASGAESEISKFSETSRAKKQTFAVLAKGKVFFVAFLCVFFLSLAMILQVGVFPAISKTAPFLLVTAD